MTKTHFRIALFIFIIILISSLLLTTGCSIKEQGKAFLPDDPFLLVLTGHGKENGVKAYAIYYIDFNTSKKSANILLIPFKTEALVTGVDEQSFFSAYVYGGGEKLIEAVNAKLNLQINSYIIYDNDDLDSSIKKIGALNYQPQPRGKVFLQEKSIEMKENQTSLSAANSIELLNYLDEQLLSSQEIFTEKLAFIRALLDSSLKSRDSQKNGSFILQPSETNLNKNELSQLNKAFFSLEAEKLYFNYLPGRFKRIGDENFWSVNKNDFKKLFASFDEDKPLIYLFSIQPKEVKVVQKEEKKPAPPPPPPIDKGTFKVSVLNGNGKANGANEMVQKVRSLGWQVTIIDNAPNFNYANSLVYFHGNQEQAAKQLSQEVGISQIWPAEQGMSTATELILIVGHDQL